MWVWVWVCIPYPVRESVSGEDGPGSPVGVMAILFVHMLSQAIDIMGRKPGGQLYVLVRKHQRSKCSVKPE